MLRDGEKWLRETGCAFTFGLVHFFAQKSRLKLIIYISAMPQTNPAIQAYFDRIQERVLPPSTLMRARSGKYFVEVEDAAFSNKVKRRNWVEKRQKRRGSYLKNTLNWKDAVILTTSMSISVFCNNDFLTDMTPMPEAMEYHDNSGTKLHQWAALYLDMVVRYDPEGITNFIAFNDLLRRGYEISFKNNIFTAVWPYANGHSLQFINQAGVYVLRDSESAQLGFAPTHRAQISYVSHVESIPAPVTPDRNR